MDGPLVVYWVVRQQLYNRDELLPSADEAGSGALPTVANAACPSTYAEAEAGELVGWRCGVDASCGRHADSNCTSGCGQLSCSQAADAGSGAGSGEDLPSTLLTLQPIASIYTPACPLFTCSAAAAGADDAIIDDSGIDDSDCVAGQTIFIFGILFMIGVTVIFHMGPCEPKPRWQDVICEPHKWHRAPPSGQIQLVLLLSVAQIACGYVLISYPKFGECAAAYAFLNRQLATASPLLFATSLLPLPPIAASKRKSRARVLC